ncbi:MAG: hypothetical protein HPPSJP_2360 [Candidatus Hepatoplasma scabrum]|nr:MAG: hypothetical protein HPPSJP_2360 [Candidatus Hepatoplasma sp.]
MKKLFIAFLIPLILIEFNSFNSFFNKKEKDLNLNQNDNIINLSLGGNASGATVDTNSDKAADSLYMWGANDYGGIGDNSTEDKYVPIEIIPAEQEDWGGNIIDLSLGDYGSGATVDTDLDGYADTLYMWGNDTFGQIGDGSIADHKYIPTKITPQGQSDWGGNIIDLDLGSTHSGVTIDTDLDGYADTLYMWGDNSNGQIGDNTRSPRYVPKKITPSEQTNWGGNIIDLNLGTDHSGLTIDEDLDGYADTLYMWGANSSGEIGDNSTNNKLIPTKITPQNQSDWGGNIIDLSLGSDHSGATIDTDLNGYADTLYMWGYNGSGQIGDNSTNNKLIPTKITPQNQSDWNGNIIDLSLGYYHSGVTIDIDLDGYADILYMWGRNNYGQIGDNSTNNKDIPIKIIPQGQSDWNADIIDLSLGGYHSGVTIDKDLDGYADTLYMWGYNADGQLGDNSTVDKHVPTIIDSSFDFLINEIEFYYQQGNKIEFNIILNDYKNILNQEPIITLVDQNNDNYTTTFINDKSNIESDQYYYQINDIMYGQSYDFTKIIINGNEFELNQQEITIDYLISSYNFVSATEETATFALNLDQNSNNFDINGYTNDQRKIKINYTDLDNNISNSKEFFIDDNYQFELTNLNAETNYQIDIVQYFYDDNQYKYEVNQDPTKFITEAAVPEIKADTISLVDNSLQTSEFQYTLEIDNLKTNSDKTNFTQYDVNEGIWLIDQDNNYYHSTFIDAKIISNGSINGTQNYQLTFLQDNLITGQTYQFIGLSIIDPNISNDDVINFSNPFIIETTIIDKNFVNDSFIIDQSSITKNSFTYTVAIDNLILLDDNEQNPVFENFNLEDGLYLIDNDNDSYNSNYIEGSAIKLSENQENGTMQYQFSFEVNNLKANTTYNFTSLSFTNSIEDDSLDISENGIIKTDNNNTTKNIIYLIMVILIILIILILVLLFVDLRMKKKTKEISKMLDDPNAFEKK